MQTSLISPNWLAGTEKKFAEYIEKIDSKSKLALLSHTDCDGLTSAKVIESVIPPDTLIFADYTELNSSLIAKLKKAKTTHIIISDLNITSEEFIKEIEKFAEILIIDHHLFKKDFNSERTTFLNAQGFCTAYLAYYLFSKIHNLENLDWLVASACISDWCWKLPADWLKEVYTKYNENFIPEEKEIRKGKFWEIAYTIDKARAYYAKNKKKVYSLIPKEFNAVSQLEKPASKIQKEIEICLKRFETERTPIQGGYFWEFSSKHQIKEFLINELSHNSNPSTTLIVATESSNKQVYFVSARRQDSTVNLPDLLAQLTAGFENTSSGGHKAAAGANMPIRYKPLFLQRLGVNKQV